MQENIRQCTMDRQTHVLVDRQADRYVDSLSGVLGPVHDTDTDLKAIHQPRVDPWPRFLHTACMAMYVC